MFKAIGKTLGHFKEQSFFTIEDDEFFYGNQGICAKFKNEVKANTISQILCNAYFLYPKDEDESSVFLFVQGRSHRKRIYVISGDPANHGLQMDPILLEKIKVTSYLYLQGLAKEWEKIPPQKDVPESEVITYKKQAVAIDDHILIQKLIKNKCTFSQNMSLENHNETLFLQGTCQDILFFFQHLESSVCQVKPLKELTIQVIRGNLDYYKKNIEKTLPQELKSLLT